MKKNYLILMTGAFMVLSNYISAHEVPIEKQWCQDGHLVIFGEFKLTPRYLESFVQGDDCDSQLGGVETKSCGQFDDDYFGARAAATHLCHSLSRKSDDVSRVSYSDKDTIKPIFNGPESIRNRNENHHQLYLIQQGVSFSCAKCIYVSDKTF